MSTINNQKILSFRTCALFGFVFLGLFMGCNTQAELDQISDNSSIVDTEIVTETAMPIDSTVAPVTSTATATLALSATATSSAAATATLPPSPTSTSSPSSLIATVTPLEEWIVYENEFYGYQFSYPPEANIRVGGVETYPSDEKPEGVSDDAFLDQLKETYPDDICVMITYGAGVVTILAPQDNGGRYTDCGSYGIGAEYDIVEKTEVVTVNGKPYTFEGIELWSTDRERAVRELMYLDLPDDTQIHYGRIISASDDQSVKDVLMQIMATIQYKDDASPTTAQLDLNK